MKKKQNSVFSLSLLVAVFCLSCQTIGSDRPTMMDDRLTERIAEIEILLLRSLFSESPSWQLADQALEELESERVFNNDFLMRIQGLRGYLTALQGKANKAADLANQGLAADPGECYFYLAGALAAESAADRWAILETGLAAARDRGQILLAMGDHAFASGDYLGAAAYFEEALQKLPAYYAGFYSEKKELAFSLQEYQGIRYETTAYLTIEELTFAHLLALTLLESQLIAEAAGLAETEAENLDTEAAYDTLVSNGFLGQSLSGVGAKVTRKDIASLLYKAAESLDPFFSRQLNLTSAFSSQELSELGAVSPIDDIALEDAVFAAVVYTVEREFLELPDGANFYPGYPISGLEYFGVLKRAEDYFESIAR